MDISILVKILQGMCSFLDWDFFVVKKFLDLFFFILFFKIFAFVSLSCVLFLCPSIIYFIILSLKNY